MCPLLSFSRDEEYFPHDIFGTEETQNMFRTLADDAPLYFAHHPDARFVTYMAFFRREGGVHHIKGHAYDGGFVRIHYDDKYAPVEYRLESPSAGACLKCGTVRNNRPAGRSPVPCASIVKNDHGRAIIFVEPASHAFIATRQRKRHDRHERRTTPLRCLAKTRPGDDETRPEYVWNPYRQLVHIDDPLVLVKLFGGMSGLPGMPGTPSGMEWFAA